MKGYIITVMMVNVPGMILQRRLSGRVVWIVRFSPSPLRHIRGKAVRPAYSVLDKSKIRKVFGVTVPDWKEALGRMLKEMQSF